MNGNYKPNREKVLAEMLILRSLLFFAYCIVFPALIIGLMLATPSPTAVGDGLNFNSFIIKMFVIAYLVFFHVSLGISLYLDITSTSKPPAMIGILGYYRMVRVRLAELIDQSVFPIHFLVTTLLTTSAASLILSVSLLSFGITSWPVCIGIGLANFLLLVVPLLFLYRRIENIVYPPSETA